MPLYEIYHVSPMPPGKQEDLAHAITRIHTSIFGVPSLFVNVEFHEVAGQFYYVAGKRRRLNRITAHVRHNDTRSSRHYSILIKAITDAWLRIVADLDLSGPTVHDEKTGKMTEEYERKMNAVPEHMRLSRIFVSGSLVAGNENGLDMPEAGQDREWILKNLDYFKKRSAEGDEDWQSLLDEIHTRKDFRGILPDEEIKEEDQKQDSGNQIVPETRSAEEKMKLEGLVTNSAAKQWKDSNVRSAETRVDNETTGGSSFGERIGSIFSGTTPSKTQ